jgi:hypothetical protein
MKNYLEFIKINENVNVNVADFSKQKWRHYTDTDDININPNPIHSDPSGIYMFPETSFDSAVGYWKIKKNLFTIKIKSNLNILNLDTITKDEELDIVNKLNSVSDLNKNYYVLFMKYYHNDYEDGYGYCNFWTYIRNVYGYQRSFKMTDDFKKLGYDGIYSTKTIHILEPQLVIFDLKNLIILKKEKTEKIFSIEKYYKKVFIILSNLIKEHVPKDFEISEKRYSINCLKRMYIKIGKGDIYFSIDIKVIKPRDIFVNINPYRIKNYSMGVHLNIHEADWNYFNKNIIKDIKAACDEINYFNMKIENKILKFSDFLNEKNDFKFEHDIEKQFNYLNKLLFNNELKMPIYSFNMNKNRSAWVSFNIIRNKYGTAIDITNIVLHFSKNYIFTPEQFMNTLAHEMIHLYQFHKKILNDRGGDHGLFFTHEMDRINMMNVNIKITPTNDAIEPSQQRKDLKKEKDFYVIFFNYRSEFILCPFSVKEECEKFWVAAVKSLSIASKPITLYMGKTNMYELNHYTIARTAKNVKQFVISKEMFDKLIKETELYKKEDM